MIRWTSRRKHIVVMQVISNAIPQSEACALYGLSLEELFDWVERFRNGDSLKATRRRSVA